MVMLSSAVVAVVCEDVWCAELKTDTDRCIDGQEKISAEFSRHTFHIYCVSGGGDREIECAAFYKSVATTSRAHLVADP